VKKIYSVRLFLKASDRDKIPFADALKALKTGQYEFGASAPTEPLPSQAPAAPAR
jgi:hypothetical protein